MSILSTLVRELQRTLSYMPTLSGNLAWRVCPADFKAIEADLTHYLKDREQSRAIPGELWLLGIRIFEDRTAPRIEPHAETFIKAVQEEGCVNISAGQFGLPHGRSSR